ncbi:hypothetical protein COO60DRAFT_1642829 [Scenedesmus sp. NREL 46B-D3]|nr:hypothetical protein COO60DRAFT_1642829 [Scenedesmus sp. NREL 46B-D3]
MNDQQRTVLLVVPDYKPSFYLPCPLKADTAQKTFSQAHPEDIRQLHRHLNARLPSESQLESVEVQQQRPIMYYRPEQPEGIPFLKCTLKPGAGHPSNLQQFKSGPGVECEKAAGAVEKVVADGSLAGFSWRQRGTNPHEADVKPLTRFLCDASLSGGSWLWACAYPQHSSSSSSSSSSSRPPQQQQLTAAAVKRFSRWFLLAAAAAGAAVLQQLDPVPPALRTAAAAAAAGDILPLRLLVLDVLAAPSDGSSRTCNAEKDPAVAVTCHVTLAGSSSSSSEDNAHQGGSSSGGDEMKQQQQQQHKVAFVLAGAAAQGGLPRQLLVEGFTLLLFASEADMLLAWRDWVQRADPDGIAVFQVRDNLGVLAARFAALNLDGGACHISRAARQHSRGLSTKSVVMYSAAWVKSQSRMASTSNQETFRALGLPGRLVLDVLRQVLTGQGLATFSLVDCCHSLLNRTLEVIPSHTLAALQQQLAATPAATAPAATATAAAAAAAAADILVDDSQLPGVRAGLRLARYSLGRCGAVAELLGRLATVPEVFEMARATGLTLEQVLYNAQMIRTWSLLLRTAHRRGYIVAGRFDAAALVESPYLMHPIEHKTAGLYNTPVATLDFASLYPSLYRAYNLCYTTLVHPDDVARIGADNCTITPTGAAFLQPSVRPGILPAILSALMSARATTRGALKGVQKQLQQARQAKQQQPEAASSAAGPAAARQHVGDSVLQLTARAAVLDGRQKALKLTANALYGFTGAQASPLQCAPLADSCLAMGAATCKTAAAAITAALQQGLLGPKGEAGKAVALGQQAAQLVTAQLPPPIELKYERVLCPFMLLHVNRYAGCSYETAAAAEAGEGQLLVKGVKAGALEHILMQRDVAGAVKHVEGQIARLLSGRVELWELVMTGGLWRVTGQQLEKAAAAAAADAGGNGGAAAAGGDEDVKGPHASLAVRLSQRDPDKKWLLGERLPYVLLTGARTQDEAAEDPLTAAQLGVSPNYELYFTNKLQIPLKEIFVTCLNPDQMRQLLHGDHTKLRASTTTAGDLGASTTQQQQQQQQQQEVGGGQDVSAAGGAPGRGARGRRGRGGGRGSSSSRGAATAAAAGAPALSPDRKKGGAGFGMRAFFQQSARCLGCKAVIYTKAPAAASSRPTSEQQQRHVDPGLCERCLQEDDTRKAVQIAVTKEASDAAAKVCAAQSACRSCHSGGQLGAVVCENGECPVVYARLSGERQVATAEHKLLRLERLDW